MHAPAGQPPDQIAVDRAKEQITIGRFLARALNSVEDPFHLGAGKIGIEQKTGLRGEHRLMAAAAQSLANIGCAAVLPDNRLMDRLAGVFIPDHRGFALVGNANGGNVTCA